MHHIHLKKVSFLQYRGIHTQKLAVFTTEDETKYLPFRHVDKLFLISAQVEKA